jgi:hypothetical protein
MADEQFFTPPADSQANDNPSNSFDPNFQSQDFNPYSQNPQDVNTNFGEQSFEPYQAPNSEVTGVDAGYQPNNFETPTYDPTGSTYETNQFDPNLSGANSFDPNLASPNTSTFDTGVDPNTSYGAANYGATDPNLVNTGETINTFTEKKTGNNKLFLIIAGVLVVLLLAGIGWIYFLSSARKENNAKKDNNTAVTTPVDEPKEQVVEEDTTEQNEDEVDVSLTGGEGTFATLARDYNAKEVTNEWNIRRFIVPTINATSGECLNVAICGADADADKDGLTTIDEYNFGTDPLLNDTDQDGLADGDELFIYYTDPKTDDSDVDTFTDGQEVVGCYDPAKNGKGVKFGTKELSLLKRNTSVSNLYEPTIETLKAAGADNADITEVGTISAKCDVDVKTVKKASASETAEAAESDNSTTNESDSEADSGTSTTKESTSTTTKKQNPEFSDEEDVDAVVPN